MYFRIARSPIGINCRKNQKAFAVLLAMQIRRIVHHGRVKPKIGVFAFAGLGIDQVDACADRASYGLNRNMRLIVVVYPRNHGYAQILQAANTARFCQKKNPKHVQAWGPPKRRTPQTNKAQFRRRVKFS
jgi:hypothetical protein